MAVGEMGVEPGGFVGNYRVVRRLGAGAMGEVFLAVHPVIGSHVAIKVLTRDLSARPEMARRFVAEAKAANRIDHPNIIKIFDFGRLADSRLYLVMEYLKGRDLAHLLRERGSLDLAEVRDIFAPVLSAMAAAHRAGIVHRDLKPSNIFLHESSAGPVVKVLDFGIAKLLEAGEDEGLETKTGTVLGTPYYMAPEQALGRIADISPRSDVYALGVILYQMLSGRLPITGSSAVEILMAHVGEPPVPLEDVAPNLPQGLYELIHRCLAKDPSFRYQDAGALLEAFQEAVGPDAPGDRRESRSSAATPADVDAALAPTVGSEQASLGVSVATERKTTAATNAGRRRYLGLALLAALALVGTVAFFAYQGPRKSGHPRSIGSAAETESSGTRASGPKSARRDPAGPGPSAPATGVSPSHARTPREVSAGTSSREAGTARASVPASRSARRHTRASRARGRGRRHGRPAIRGTRPARPRGGKSGKAGQAAAGGTSERVEELPGADDIEELPTGGDEGNGTKGTGSRAR